MTDRTAWTGGPWRFEYEPATIRFGEGSAAGLSEELDGLGLERALVVSGRTVGTTDAVVEPVRAGLGDRFGAMFAETTAEKRLSTAVAAAERYVETGADCIVGLGGGSSLDLAKMAAIAVGSDRSPAALGSALAETGTLPVPGEVPPLIAIPTTLAGADLSSGGGVSASAEEGLVGASTGGAVWDPSLMPAAIVADPSLVATTPRAILAPSAMNGFDKGIEALYAPTATPITDGTAANGLSLLVDGLPALGEAPVTADQLNPIVRGVLLVQYGMSRPGSSTLSLIHAFGHILSAAGPHQGTTHSVVAPHVLRYVFEGSGGPRPILAAALGVGGADDEGEAVVRAVADVRDAMGLPSRLRDLDGIQQDDLPNLAAEVLTDDLAGNVPPGVDPDPADMEAVLEAAW